MFKDGQAIILFRSECSFVKNNCQTILCHSGASESWRSCPNPMRQANFILCGQFFSQRNATRRNATHRFRSFRKLPFKIHYKKMSATRRIGVSRPLLSHSVLFRTNKFSHEIYTSTAVGQAVACAPITQRARVRSPVGTSFLGEVFSTPVRQTSGSFRPPKVPEYHSAIIIIHNHSLRRC